jgi:biopolymer transport protein ExbD
MLTISIEASGAMSIDGVKVDDAELRRRASAMHDGRAVIHAARAASHGAVIHVIDELRVSGITRIAFAAERPS